MIDLRPVVFLMTFAVCVGAYADENARELKLEHGAVAVHLKGDLSVGTSPKKGADPKARLTDRSAWELDSASVNAGGAEVYLDWSDSPDAREELLFWRLPRHGDFRRIQAEVTGRMTFKSLKSLPGSHIIPPGGSIDSVVPVVAVESLKVKLVDQSGNPTRNQPDRTRLPK